MCAAGDAEGASALAFQTCRSQHHDPARLSIGQAPQIVTSALSLASTLPILYLLSRQLHRGFFVTLLPGLGLAAAMILVDQTFGSGAFGAVAIIPAVLSRNGIAPRK